MNEYTFRGVNSAILIFASLLNWNQSTVKEEVKRKSQVFPFVKKVETHGGVLLGHNMSSLSCLQIYIFFFHFYSYVLS